MRRLCLFFLVFLFTAGCGVPKNRYNELLREKESLRDQLTVAQTEKGKIEKEKEQMTQELAATRTKLEEVIAEKEALREEYDRLMDTKVSLKIDHDRLLREKQVLESHVFELEKQSQKGTP